MKQIINKVKGGGQFPSKVGYLQIIKGFIGGAIGIGCIGLLAQWQQIPLLIAPFGASCVLLFAAPDSPLAQPRNVIGGHFLSSLVGIVFLIYVGHSAIEMGLAVGLAIAVMQAGRVLHPPAGADPLLILMTGSLAWDYLLIPVLLGSVLLVVIALVVNNIGHKKWPNYW